MSANGIAQLPTREERQKAKLDLAAAKRAADGNPRATYDITQLPTQYDADDVIDNPNVGGLVQGRPWVSTPPIITAGLVLHLDAGDTDSYPGTGSTWYDLSPSGKNATLNQVGSSTFYSSADGGSMSFLGSSLSYATITSASAITGLTNNMTIEVWYKSSGNITPRFLSTGAGSDGICFGSWTTSPTKWKVSKYGQVDLYVGSVPQNANVWRQAVLVYSSTEGTKVYVDGVLSETNADTTVIQGSATPTITIGKVESTYHKGDISIIRWYNTVLSDAEILQNYNANIGRYTNPAAPANLLIYYDPSNPISYLAGSNVLSLGAASFTSVMTNVTHTKPYFTYNGTNSWLNLADGAGYEPGSSDFSVEIWVYHSVIAGSSRVLVGKTDTGGLASNWSYGLRTSAEGSTYFEVGNGTTSIQSPAFTLSTGQWYQVVGVWTNVGTKTMELYVNGESKGSITHTFTSVKNSSRGLYIGSYNANEYAQSLNGRTGVFRQYNKALTSAEVLQNYNNDRGLYGI